MAPSTLVIPRPDPGPDHAPADAFLPPYGPIAQAIVDSVFGGRPAGSPAPGSN